MLKSLRANIKRLISMPYPWPVCCGGPIHCGVPNVGGGDPATAVTPLMNRAILLFLNFKTLISPLRNQDLEVCKKVS